MHIVHQTNHLFEAHLVRHALEQAEIPAFVLGESLIGGMGELPSLGLLKVGVPPSYAQAADAVVAELGLGTDAAAPIFEPDQDPGALPA